MTYRRVGPMYCGLRATKFSSSRQLGDAESHAVWRSSEEAVLLNQVAGLGVLECGRKCFPFIYLRLLSAASMSYPIR